jgi:hypothetical protein
MRSKKPTYEKLKNEKRSKITFQHGQHYLILYNIAPHIHLQIQIRLRFTDGTTSNTTLYNIQYNASDSSSDSDSSQVYRRHHEQHYLILYNIAPQTHLQIQIRRFVHSFSIVWLGLDVPYNRNLRFCWYSREPDHLLGSLVTTFHSNCDQSRHKLHPS